MTLSGSAADRDTDPCDIMLHVGLHERMLPAF